jgi:hypothetical protein
MFPNFTNYAQVSKELRHEINNNNASSIQLKLKTQVEVDE